MSKHDDEDVNFNRWQYLLAGCIGGCSVLLITAVQPFPPTPDGMYFETVAEWFVNPVYGGWLWACAAIGLLSGLAGLLLIVRPRYHQLEGRLNMAVAFFMVAWLSFLAFLLREELFLSNSLALLLLLILGVIFGGYWWLRHRLDQREQTFP